MIVPVITLPLAGLRERGLKSMAGLPPFSPVLNRLLASFSAEDASIATISDVVAKDAVIAGNVLRLVNSAMYGRPGVVTSLTHASSLLGLNRLRNAVLGISISRMWNQIRTPQGWSAARFNLHGVATALMADLLAQRVRAEFPEGAFLAGLFHDVGKLLCAIGLREEYEPVRAVSAERGISRLDAERELLGFTHAELSADAVEVWRLPEPIRLAVLYHHSSELRTASVPHGSHSLASVVSAANVYVNAIGITADKETLSLPADFSAQTAFEPLGIERDVPRLVEEFKAEYDALTSFFR